MVDLHEPAPVVGNRPRILLAYVSVILLALVVVAGAALGTYLIVHESPFDPLRYPDGYGQTVLSRVHGVDGPAVRLGRNVHVSGTACNLSRSPVAIRGRVFWTISRPPGTSLLVFQSAARWLPGCHRFTFSNPMPPAVVAIARRRPGVRWRINGDVVPLAAHGAPRYWQTQEFRIVP